MATWKKIITEGDNSAYKNSNVNATDIDANVSNTEFSYLNGVTSAIQTQLDSKISATLTTEQVQDIVGGMVTGNTETRIAVTYEDGDGTLDFVVDDQSTPSGYNNSNWDTAYGWGNHASGGYQDEITSSARLNANLISAGNVSNTEFDYLNGVTSAIQTQLNAKIEATLTTEQVQDIVGGMFSGNTETRISATYEDGDGTIDLVVDDMTSTGTDVDVNVSNLTARLPQITESVTIGDASDVTVTTSGNLTVTGDLQINGNTVTTDAETILVKDNTMVLNSDLGSGASAVSSGICVERGSGNNFSLFCHSSGAWYLGNESTNQQVGTTTASLANITQSASSDASGSPTFGLGTFHYNRTNGKLWLCVSDTPGGG